MRRDFGLLLSLFILLTPARAHAQDAFFGRLTFGTPTTPLCVVQTGTGSPNSAVVGSVCDTFLRTDGGASTVLYIKESGTATNTGWVAYGAAGGTVTASAGNLTARAVVLGAGTTDTRVVSGLGTSGQVLTSNGSMADPTFQSVAGSGTVTASAGALTANEIVLGAGTTDTKVLASLGTTTTLLHGNAGGAPTFGAVSLSADVTGTLVMSSLGTAGTPQFARVGFGSAADATAVATFTGEYFSPLVADGNSGTTKTLDLSQGNEHFLTLTGNVTLTVTNPVDGGRYVFVLATGAGSFTVTWPGTFKWSGGSAPTITVTASKTDVCTAIYVASVTTYYAACNQNF